MAKEVYIGPTSTLSYKNAIRNLTSTKPKCKSKQHLTHCTHTFNYTVFLRLLIPFPSLNNFFQT